MFLKLHKKRKQLVLYKDDYNSLAKLELSFFKNFFGVGVEFKNDGVYNITLHFHIPYIVAIWFTVARFKLVDWLCEKLLPSGYKDRTICIDFHNYSVWWKIWTDPMSWKSSTPKWQDGNFNFVDFILGKPVFSKTIIGTYNVIIPLTEGKYNATVSIANYVWSRKRWFDKKQTQASINVEGGVPIPGKGESSWNCGEDKVYSVTCAADSKARAIVGFIEDILTIREKRSGDVNWISKKKYNILI